MFSVYNRRRVFSIFNHFSSASKGKFINGENKRLLSGLHHTLLLGILIVISLLWPIQIPEKNNNAIENVDSKKSHRQRHCQINLETERQAIAKYWESGKKLVCCLLSSVCVFVLFKPMIISITADALKCFTWVVVAGVFISFEAFVDLFALFIRESCLSLISCLKVGISLRSRSLLHILMGLMHVFSWSTVTIVFALDFACLQRRTNLF